MHPEFATELEALPIAVRNELAALTVLLGHFGPSLKRPHCDTLNGSSYANMKELRFLAADGAWRVAFAFDQQRRAVLLVAGDKSDTSSARFYKRLIRKADARYKKWLED